MLLVDVPFGSSGLTSTHAILPVISDGLLICLPIYYAPQHSTNFVEDRSVFARSPGAKPYLSYDPLALMRNGPLKVYSKLAIIDPKPVTARKYRAIPMGPKIRHRFIMHVYISHALGFLELRSTTLALDEIQSSISQGDRLKFVGLCPVHSTARSPVFFLFRKFMTYTSIDLLVALSVSVQKPARVNWVRVVPWESVRTRVQSAPPSMAALFLEHPGMAEDEEYWVSMLDDTEDEVRVQYRVLHDQASDDPGIDETESPQDNIFLSVDADLHLKDLDGYGPAWREVLEDMGPYTGESGKIVGDPPPPPPGQDDSGEGEPGDNG